MLASVTKWKPLSSAGWDSDLGRWRQVHEPNCGTREFLFPLAQPTRAPGSSAKHHYHPRAAERRRSREIVMWGIQQVGNGNRQPALGWLDSSLTHGRAIARPRTTSRCGTNNSSKWIAGLSRTSPRPVPNAAPGRRTGLPSPRLPQGGHGLAAHVHKRVLEVAQSTRRNHQVVGRLDGLAVRRWRQKK
jgi:hypothetical protein